VPQGLNETHFPLKLCMVFSLINIPCENLCETFSIKLRKSCEIAFFLENGFSAITAIATGFTDGVKLGGTYS
jgi:hypothetical protein